MKAGDKVRIVSFGRASASDSYTLGEVYELSKDYNRLNGFIAKDNHGSCTNGWSNAFDLGIVLEPAETKEINNYQIY